jgi:hypothetical protein
VGTAVGEVEVMEMLFSALAAALLLLPNSVMDT